MGIATKNFGYKLLDGCWNCKNVVVKNYLDSKSLYFCNYDRTYVEIKDYSKSDDEEILIDGTWQDEHHVSPCGVCKFHVRKEQVEE